eukprot:4862-Heterococcus_DN1.PRE.1
MSGLLNESTSRLGSRVPRCGLLSHGAQEGAKEAARDNTGATQNTNLSALLERAKCGDSSQAVKAYLDAGGSVAAQVRGEGPAAALQVPLLHYMASYNAHPHTELAESVKLLVEAGADIDAKVIAASDDGIYSTVLSGADVWEKSSAK